MNIKFEVITNEDRLQIESLYRNTIIDDCRKEMREDGCYRYEITLQGANFFTYLTDEELEGSISLAIDVLEELKEINNSGLDRNALIDIIENIETSSDVMRVIKIFNKIRTEKLEEIIREIDKVQRVGGAYALFISNPVLISAIYAIYDRLVDSFDDEELYCHSGYFLLRAILKMHSEESD